MSQAPGYSRDVPSEAPMTIDARDDWQLQTGPAAPTHRSRHSRAWMGMTGYLIAGGFLGLLLVLALSIGRSDASASTAKSRDAVTDNVVHLHAGDVAASCWNGYDKLGPARLTVALEIGIDGKIRYAAASGETQAIRSCVEAHVRRWEFLPQAEAQTMALPFEVDRR